MAKVSTPTLSPAVVILEHCPIIKILIFGMNRFQYHIEFGGVIIDDPRNQKVLLSIFGVDRSPF